MAEKALVLEVDIPGRQSGNQVQEPPLVLASGYWAIRLRHPRTRLGFPHGEFRPVPAAILPILQALAAS